MKHCRTILEAKVQDFSALKYGTNPLERMEKLLEEVSELDEAVIAYQKSPTKKNFEKFKDELGDSLFVLISLVGIYGTNIGELMENTMYKIKMRETDKNYKR